MDFTQIYRLLEDTETRWFTLKEVLDTLEDINVVNSDGLSLLHLLIRYDPEKLWIIILLYLFERKIDLELRTHGINETALVYASRRHRYQYIQLLVDHGANVNAADEHKDTALLWCVYSGHLDMVQYLIANGANPYHNYCNNRNSLMWAVVQNKVRVARYLSDRFFGDINQEDRFGHTIFTLSNSFEMNAVLDSALQRTKLMLFLYLKKKNLDSNCLMDRNLIRMILSFYN